MDHKPYIIRNDRTGKSWTAMPAEARLYAVGGILDTSYSVFERYGSGQSLIVFEVK